MHSGLAHATHTASGGHIDTQNRTWDVRDSEANDVRKHGWQRQVRRVVFVQPSTPHDHACRDGAQCQDDDDHHETRDLIFCNKPSAKAKTFTKKTQERSLSRRGPKGNDSNKRPQNRRLRELRNPLLRITTTTTTCKPKFWTALAHAQHAPSVVFPCFAPVVSFITCRSPTKPQFRGPNHVVKHDIDETRKRHRVDVKSKCSQ